MPAAVLAPDGAKAERGLITLRCTSTVGALTIRMGVWGVLHYSYNQEPPKIVFVII